MTESVKFDRGWIHDYHWHTVKAASNIVNVFCTISVLMNADVRTGKLPFMLMMIGMIGMASRETLQNHSLAPPAPLHTQD